MIAQPDIDLAYSKSKSATNRFLANHDFIPHLDKEDYIQEGMLAWLKGWSIKMSNVSTFREGAPLSRLDKITKPPDFCDIDEIEVSTNGLEGRYLLKQLYDQMMLIEKPLIRYVLVAYYFADRNGEDLAKELAMTESNVSLLKKEGIRILRKRLKLPQ